MQPRVAWLNIRFYAQETPPSAPLCPKDAHSAKAMAGAMQACSPEVGHREVAPVPLFLSREPTPTTAPAWYSALQLYADKTPTAALFCTQAASLGNFLSDPVALPTYRGAGFGLLSAQLPLAAAHLRRNWRRLFIQQVH